ncbi:MAG: PEGA domain-containing protein [Acidobacteria bacterium]|nr:PEGA domain-containing protein [Acidobacteriota bacterium]
MKRAMVLFFLSSAVTHTVLGEHFFLPPRTLFHFRPELYVYGPIYIPRVVVPYCPPEDYGHVPGFVSSKPLRAYQFWINSPAGNEIVRANTSDLVLNVIPDKSLVYIDGKLVGNANDFATEKESFTLVDGNHRLRLEYPGHKPFESQLKVVPNRTIVLDVELEKE